MISKDITAINASYLLGWLSSRFGAVLDGKFLPPILPDNQHVIYLDDEIYDMSVGELPSSIVDPRHVYVCKIRWVHEYLLAQGCRSVLFPWFHIVDDCISMHLLQEKLHPQYPVESQRNYFCLNRCDRIHRRLLVEHLNSTGLISKGLITYREIDIGIDGLYQGDNLDHYVCSNVGFERHQSETQGIHISATADNFVRVNQHYVQPINISAETITAFEFFPTEKSVLAFATKRIPLIAAYQGQIQVLRDQGFEMFDWLLDHNYDGASDYWSRTAKLIDLNREVLEQGISVDQRVKDALDYNYNYLINRWLANKLSELEETIDKLLSQ
jgi:hypothetical protein